jgi:hypothetical protein
MPVLTQVDVLYGIILNNSHVVCCTCTKVCCRARDKHVTDDFSTLKAVVTYMETS